MEWRADFGWGGRGRPMGKGRADTGWRRRPWRIRRRSLRRQGLYGEMVQENRPDSEGPGGGRQENLRGRQENRGGRPGWRGAAGQPA